MPNLSAFNLIVASFANRINGGGVMVGRNRYFFPTAAEPFDLGGGLEAWKGFYSSVRPAHKQLMVNVNGMLSWIFHQSSLS
jgi:eukaryotic translation initiation factor 2C